MKITLVFILVPGVPHYDAAAKRWLESYHQFKPAIPHEVLLVKKTGDPVNPDFDYVTTSYLDYDGGGWDCGTWQHVGKTVSTDLLVCMNTRTRLVRSGWLERIVVAVERHGLGLYGPWASYEIKAHIRTPCMIFQPEIIRDYPVIIDSRERALQFESHGTVQADNFSWWCMEMGYTVKLVTWDGEYDQPKWRSPRNIFRRGDQSNCLLFDRHCDIYAEASPEEKQRLERLADGITG